MSDNVKKNSILNLKHAWKFKYYFFLKLPSIIYWGVKLKSLSDEVCVTTIPFKRKTQNPFRSIYFGALAGTAELCTGLLMLSKLEKHGDNFSKLVVNFEMEFFKKADNTVEFTCDQGSEIEKILEGLDGAIKIPLTATGRIGETVVAKAVIHWSIKAR